MDYPRATDIDDDNLVASEITSSFIKKYLVPSICVLSGLTIAFWIFRLVVLSIIFAVFAVLLITKSIGQYTNSKKSIAVYSSSIETMTQRSHEIIPFDDIISIKVQYQRASTGFNTFHPTDIAFSLIASIFNIQQDNRNLLEYRIETELHVYHDVIYSVNYDKILQFVQLVQQKSEIKPMIRDFQLMYSTGTLFYFSFIGKHPDLDPDIASDLV